MSQKVFEVWQCDNCTVRFTQDAPVSHAIGEFYKSADYISHTNTSRGLVNQLYQIVRRRTLKQKRKLVCNVTGKDEGALLDVGSGTGSFVNEMMTHGWTVTGLEPDSHAREVAKEHFNCDLKNSDELFRLAPAAFDAITLWHVLEHVHNLEDYLQQIKILLKNGGRVIIAVPNYKCFDASVYKEYWAAYDVPRHLYHFSPQSMQTLLQKNDMKIIERKPMWFDSFYVSLLSSKNKNRKTNWLGAMWIGLRSNLRASGNKKNCSSLIYIVSLKG